MQPTRKKEGRTPEEHLEKNNLLYIYIDIQTHIHIRFYIYIKANVYVCLYV
jgi:hypothetical protein